MDYATTFYILGGALAALAVLTSFAGLRFEGFPGRLGPVVVLVFVALVGTAATFAVLNGQQEQEARAEETAEAGKAIEQTEESPSVQAPGGEAAEAEKGEAESAEPESAAGNKAGKEAGKKQGAGKEAGKKQGAGKEAGAGPGGTLQLAADPTQIAFDKTSLTSKPGKVTIDFTNPSALEHDVAIEKEGKQIAVSPTVSEGKTSVTAQLPPGEYTFLCTIPGHAEAGMEGTLTVK